MNVNVVNANPKVTSDCRMRFSGIRTSLRSWFLWLVAETISLAQPDVALMGLLNKKNDVHDVDILINRTHANVMLKTGSRNMLAGLR